MSQVRVYWYSLNNLLFQGGGGSRMGTAPRKSSHHQRSGSNPINPSCNPIPSHTSAVSATSEDYVDMSPAASGSRPGAVPIPNRNVSSTSLSFGTSPSAGNGHFFSHNKCCTLGILLKELFA